MTKQIAARKRIRKITAYQRLFNSEDGKKVLLDLAQFVNVFTMLGPDTPSEHHHYFAGQRSVLFKIYNELNIDVSAIEQQLKEHKDERRNFGFNTG